MNNYEPEPGALILMPFVSEMWPRDNTAWMGICLGRQRVNLVE